MSIEQNPVVILSALRSPMGHFGGYFKTTKAPALGAAVIKQVIEKAQVPYEKIETVLMGCVLQAGQGQAPARQAALAAGLPPQVGACTINKMCGSGMQSVMFGHDMIKAGSVHCVVAGGMENMSMAPYLLLQARFGYRLGHQTLFDHMMLDGLEDAYDAGKPMGFFAEKCAKQYHFTRKAMDDFARESLQRAKSANQNNDFHQEIVPMTAVVDQTSITVSQDENAMKANPDKIPLLKPVFLKDGSITAANSSSISDGAAALLLMRLENAKQMGLTPLAKIVGHATFSQDPAWFTTAPIYAISQLLKKINWKLTEVDLFEINEAFAVVTMAAMKELKLSREQVNIKGGACALGHPIGASGARLLVTLVHALREKKLKKGVAALCIGGGEATAMAVELF